MEPRPSPVEPRSCGACSACCRVLRVDELRKLGGTPCPALRRDGPGCSIHATRPEICRNYRCLWLGGALRDEDRPDRLGAVLDMVTVGMRPELRITAITPGSFETTPRLQEIAADYRRTLPVRISDATDVLDPDRGFRLLLPDGEEQRVSGERIRVLRHGRIVRDARLPWPARWLRRGVVAWRRWQLRQHR